MATDGREKAFRTLLAEARKAAKDSCDLIEAADALLGSDRDRNHFRSIRDGARGLKADLEHARLTSYNSLRTWDER